MGIEHDDVVATRTVTRKAAAARLHMPPRITRASWSSRRFGELETDGHLVVTVGPRGVAMNQLALSALVLTSPFTPDGKNPPLLTDAGLR